MVDLTSIRAQNFIYKIQFALLRIDFLGEEKKMKERHKCKSTYLRDVYEWAYAPSYNLIASPNDDYRNSDYKM